ncbi:MAG: septum formation initiator family protein [Mobilitalea sp.]
MEAKKRQYQYDNTRVNYIEGNTARQLNLAPDIRREEEEYENFAPRKQQHRQTKSICGINLASLMVLTVAIIATVYVCVEYLKVQASVSTMDKEIISLENDLTELTNKNDASEEAINTAYNMDYVYRIAVEELGMVYPNKNTVITYKSNNNDYVRQYEDIPQ